MGRCKGVLGTCIFISTINSVGIRAAHATNPDSTLCFGHESYTDQVYELVYESSGDSGFQYDLCLEQALAPGGVRMQGTAIC